MFRAFFECVLQGSDTDASSLSNLHIYVFLAGLDRRSLSDLHLHRLITEKGVKTEAKEYIHSLKPLQLARDVLTTFLDGEHQNTRGSDEAVKVEKELEWDRKKA